MKPITGSIVALVTPMHDDGSVDYDALRRLIDWHIAEGTHASASSARPANRRPSPSTSTARSSASRSSTRAAACRSWPAPAATRPPRRSSCRASRSRSAPTARCRSCPTTTSRRRKASTATSRRSPRPSTSRWCSTTCPARTVADMQAETVLRLAQVPGIVGVKEASGDIVRAAALIRDVPAGFSIYSGDDDSAIALMLLGGHGNVSVTANVAPRAMQALCTAALAGDAREAARLHLQLLRAAQGACSSSRARRRPSGRCERLGRCGAARAPADHAARRSRPGRRSRRRCARPACAERGALDPTRAPVS